MNKTLQYKNSNMHSRNFQDSENKALNLIKERLVFPKASDRFRLPEM